MNKQAMQAVLEQVGLAWAFESFASSADGLALVALLGNALAKEEPAFYALKGELVAAAALAADRSTWWVDDHQWGEHGKVALFIQTGVPLPEGGFAQMVFHFGEQAPMEVMALLATAPCSNGRRWSRVPLQARAVELAESWAMREA